MFGQLEIHEIENLINHQVIARLGCYAEGKMYVVPISYAYDGKYFYAYSREGMKLELMRKNPEVCLQLDNLGQMDNWQSVILWGRFEELNDKNERNNALQKLVNRILPVLTSELVHIAPHYPFPPDELENISGVVYRIHITEKTGRFEKSIMEDHFAF
jgi:uncharacterized protein